MTAGGEPPLRQNRPLRHLLAAQVPADCADWLDYVAIGALLAFAWQAPPVAFALLAVALGLPYVTVGPFAGVLVDRSGLRRVLVASNLGRALATAALAFAPGWQALLAIVLARGVADAFFTPARQAAIQAVVPDPDLMRANGIGHAINQGAKIVAPAAGGALLVALAPGQVFLVNAAVSLVAAAILAAMPPIRRDPGAGAPEPLLAGLKAGWRGIAQSSLLRGALGLMAGGYFAMFFYDTQIAPLTRELGLDEADFGLILAAVGAGGLTGAAALGFGLAPARPLRLVAASCAVSGLLVVGLGVTELAEVATGRLPVLAVFAVLGLTSAAKIVPIRTVILSETPPALMARVTALGEAASTTALLVSPFLGAAIAAAFGVGATFVTGGALLLVLAAAAIRVDRRRT